MIDNTFPTVGEIYKFIINSTEQFDFINSENKSYILSKLELLIKEKSINIDDFIDVQNEIINILKKIIPDKNMFDLLKTIPKKIIEIYIYHSVEKIFDKKEDVYLYSFLRIGYSLIFMLNVYKTTIEFESIQKSGEKLSDNSKEFNVTIAKIKEYYFHQIELIINDNIKFNKLLDTYSILNNLINQNYSETSEYIKSEQKILLIIQEYYNEFNISTNIINNYLLLFDSLNDIFSLNKEKNVNDYVIAQTKIKEKELEIQNQTYTYLSLFYWTKARFYILQNDINKAVEFYNNSYETGKYCTGKLFLEILKEYVILICYINNDESCKKIYKIACYFGIFEEIYDELSYSEYISKQYKSTFNPKYFYK